MDDLDVFEAIREANDPNTTAMGKTSALFRAFQHIIGAEQDKALREHLTAKSGKVKTSEYKTEVEEFFASFNKKK
jgi:hypothetical protein